MPALMAAIHGRTNIRFVAQRAQLFDVYRPKPERWRWHADSCCTDRSLAVRSDAQQRRRTLSEDQIEGAVKPWQQLTRRPWHATRLSAA
jgi:hypothetical protein